MNRFMYSILLMVVVLIMSGCESSGSGSDDPPSPGRPSDDSLNKPPGPGEVQFKFKLTTTGDGKEYEQTINVPEDLDSYIRDEEDTHLFRFCLPNIDAIRKQKGSLSLSIYNPYAIELENNYYLRDLGGSQTGEKLPGLQYTIVESYIKAEPNSDGYYYPDFVPFQIKSPTHFERTGDDNDVVFIHIGHNDCE